MVRDIAREKGKDIDLIISGSETSVDKKIIEEIKSPLIHIIRNAIDYGIEDQHTRMQNGKNPKGKILLSAYHLENSVLIEVIDDGKGVDLDVIKRKVLQKKLLTSAELEGMSDEQIMNIIFWPGFSTGEVISDISGRGVGLDIVYTKISQLNGKVNIKSTMGQGCKVSIQLPVTMATVKAFLVRSK
ncbi:MAG: ATP-binding protein [Candidatus Moduliflexus flocculans]|nr:ATP-binding protein [Candidatus Moduliflexus flocculans]